MTDLAARRRFYAEEIEMTSNLQSAALVEALATVPRERFLPPGPWTVRSETDFQAGPRLTPDADPRRVYHNVAIGIDAKRMLFNGAPGLLARTIDTLRVAPGQRVLHIGTGLGYYTALIAACAGPGGGVVGIEVDPDLAHSARDRLAEMPWVDVRTGDGSSVGEDTFDAILVNAGVTHPLDNWLNALARGGRLIFPLTATMPAMGPIGKGPMVLVTASRDDGNMDARLVSFVAIYSAVGLRDDALNTALGSAMKANQLPALKTLRRDTHAPGPSCWHHMGTCCLSLQ